MNQNDPSEPTVYERVQRYLEISKTQFKEEPSFDKLINNIRNLEAELWVDGDVDWEDV
jgi:hypothetical protein